jgi:hypothetical protein
MNSLGETLRNNEYIPEIQSIDCRKLCESLGLDWTEQGFKPSKFFQKAILEAWDKNYRKNLTRKEYNFVKKMNEIHRRHGTSRFRFYGEIRNGKPKIVVVTEFIGFVDDVEFWSKADLVAKKLGAHVWVMDEGPHSDHSWHYDESGQVIDRYGDNDGRIERQVEFSWRIEKLNSEALKDFMVRLRNGTRTLFAKGGVSVS